MKTIDVRIEWTCPEPLTVEQIKHALSEQYIDDFTVRALPQPERDYHAELYSDCLSYRHDFGLLTYDEQTRVRDEVLRIKKLKLPQPEQGQGEINPDEVDDAGFELEDKDNGTPYQPIPAKVEVRCDTCGRGVASPCPGRTEPMQDDCKNWIPETAKVEPKCTCAAGGGGDGTWRDPFCPKCAPLADEAHK